MCRLAKTQTDQPVNLHSLIRDFAGIMLIAKDPTRLQADSVDSDQPAQMRRLIGVFAGRTCKFAENTVSRLIFKFMHNNYVSMFCSMDNKSFDTDADEEKSDAVA